MKRAFLRGASLVAAVSIIWSGAASGQTYNQRPIQFFVAKGTADSCGKGCNEWIAAEGAFDEHASKRLESLLAEIGRRDLPVFFNSPGGRRAEALKVGYLMRRNRMTASVGITSLAICKSPNLADDKCWRQIAGLHHHDGAQLHLAKALCASACVYALVGASARRIPPEAIVGVHSAKLTDASIKRQDADEQLRSYLADIGVDPALAVLAARIPNSSLHRLTPEEIKRFNVEPKPGETPWKGADYGDTRFVISKTLTEAEQGMLRHTTLRVNCQYGVLHFQFRREAAAVNRMVTNVKAIAGDGEIQFATTPYAAGVQGAALITREVLEKLGKLSSIKFIESYGEPAGSSGTLNIAMTGFPDELANLRKRCPGIPAL